MDEFLERYTLPRVAKISYKTPFSNETLQSSSSNNSSTITSTSSTSGDVTKVAAMSSGAATESNIISSNSNSNTGTSSSTASSGVGGSHPVTQTLGSNSSSNTSASKSTANETNQNAGNTNHHTSHDDEQGELFLLYRLVKQRNIYHGHNTKTTATNRKKGVLIPQEFPGKCLHSL